MVEPASGPEILIRIQVIDVALTFHTERFDDVIEEVLPMLRRHYEEIAWKKDKIEFNPDFDRYRQLEAADMLRIYVAREDGAIIGYAVFCVSQDLHYQDIKKAQNDIFYVEPSRRGAMIGQKLLRDYAEGELRREGVQVITLHIKTAHNWQRLAEHFGYEWTEINMSKFVGDF